MEALLLYKQSYLDPPTEARILYLSTLNNGLEQGRVLASRRRWGKTPFP